VARQQSRKPRRRWLRWLLLGLLVALIAVVATAVILVANYQPFHAGFKQYGPPKGVEATALQIDWLDAPRNVWTYRSHQQWKKLQAIREELRSDLRAIGRSGRG
jgi:hypothetical protein